MSRFKILAACAGLAASLAAPALACETQRPINKSQAELVFIGEAIAIDLTDKTYGLGLPIRPSKDTSTVTFKVIDVVKGEYGGDTIEATFVFSWFGMPPEDLESLRSGGDHQSLIGVTIDEDVGAIVMGGLCSSTFFHLKPADDASERAKEYWQMRVDTEGKIPL